MFKCVDLNILIIVQSYRGFDCRDGSKNPRRFNEETKRIIYSLIITKIISTLMREACQQKVSQWVDCWFPRHRFICSCKKLATNPFTKAGKCNFQLFPKYSFFDVATFWNSGQHTRAGVPVLNRNFVNFIHKSQQNPRVALIGTPAISFCPWRSLNNKR